MINLNYSIDKLKSFQISNSDGMQFKTIQFWTTKKRKFNVFIFPDFVGMKF